MKWIDVEAETLRAGSRCYECSDPIVLTFESEGAMDGNGLDSSAYLSFCATHSLAFMHTPTR